MAGKILIQFKLRFLLDSDWLIKSGESRDAVDVSPLTDLLGRPYIPASTIKGAIRHEFRKIASIYPYIKKYEKRLFGGEGNDLGLLYFSDATLKDVAYADLLQITRHRIALDRKRKVVRDTALLVEKVVSASTPLHSESSIYVNEQEKEDIAAIITLCFLSLQQIGGGRSIGRGKLSFAYGKGENDVNKSTIQVQFIRDNDGEKTIQDWSKEHFEDFVETVAYRWKEGV